MKRSMYVGMAALAVAALVVGTLVYADGETNTVACPCPCYGGSTVMKVACSCPYYGGSAVMKDATIVVQNTAAGVTITVTAVNAEQVQAIQTAFANFGKGTNAPCAMMNRVACQKMRRAAGCCAAGWCNVPATTGAEEDHHGNADQK